MDSGLRTVPIKLKFIFRVKVSIIIIIIIIGSVVKHFKRKRSEFLYLAKFPLEKSDSKPGLKPALSPVFVVETKCITDLKAWVEVLTCKSPDFSKFFVSTVSL
jgi:hypothetical protein